MQPYKPGHSCKKCGEVGAETRFERVNGAQAYNVATMSMMVVERMVRTCRRCGYVWHETRWTLRSTPVPVDPLTVFAVEVDQFGVKHVESLWTDEADARAEADALNAVPTNWRRNVIPMEVR